MSEKKEKVFISYSKQDAEIVQKLCNELESKGYNCFIFERDVTLVASSFIKCIIEEIKQSFVLILVISNNANNSEYVIREVNLAFENKLPIFPLRIEDVQPSVELKFLIGLTPWMDIFERPIESYYSKIVGAVERLYNERTSKKNGHDDAKDPTNTIPKPVEIKTPPSKTMESYFPQIVKAVERLYNESTAKKTSHDSANEPTITIPNPVEMKTPPLKTTESVPKNIFRNPFEDNVEYILIPGGTYLYSVTGKMETVPNLYFCKYPVTNKRYNRFVSYLYGIESGLEKVLPLEVFRQKLKVYSGITRGLKDYLGEEPQKWNEKLRPQIDDKKFKGDDQPVVCVSWYHARSYCFWLSCLEAGWNGDTGLDDVRALSEIFRLPTEIEWEWAAGGEPNGKIRRYPWAKEKGKPHPGLANYSGHVGATTPVGRYPEGATPLGLMDMAGNVWEWMNNDVDKDKPFPSLRGGSWYRSDDYLRCSARLYDYPNDWGSAFGFRVIRTRL